MWQRNGNKRIAEVNDVLYDRFEGNKKQTGWLASWWNRGEELSDILDEAVEAEKQGETVPTEDINRLEDDITEMEEAARDIQKLLGDISTW
jgi:hypothetical protein